MGFDQWRELVVEEAWEVLEGEGTSRGAAEDEEAPVMEDMISTDWCHMSSTRRCLTEASAFLSSPTGPGDMKLSAFPLPNGEAEGADGKGRGERSEGAEEDEEDEEEEGGTC